MRKFILLFALLICQVFSTTGQQFDEDKKSNFDIPEVRQDLFHNGLKFSPGQTWTFEVTENLTTGYKWQLLGDLVGFTVENDRRELRADRRMTGSPGTKIWRIKANDDAVSGTETFFHAVYARSWEEPGNHVDEIKFRLTIV